MLREDLVCYISASVALYHIRYIMYHSLSYSFLTGLIHYVVFLPQSHSIYHIYTSVSFTISYFCLSLVHYIIFLPLLHSIYHIFVSSLIIFYFYLYSNNQHFLCVTHCPTFLSTWQSRCQWQFGSDRSAKRPTR